MGRKKIPVFSIVATDSRNARDGRYIEDLGRYYPLAQPVEVSVDEDRVLYWLGNGAQPSDTVRSILRKRGIMLHHAMRQRGASEEEIAQAKEEHRQRVEDRGESIKMTAEMRRQKALEAEREKAKALEEERRKEAEAKRKAEEEAKRKAEEEAKRKAEEKAKAKEAEKAQEAEDADEAEASGDAEASDEAEASEEADEAAEPNAEAHGDDAKAEAADESDEADEASDDAEEK